MKTIDKIIELAEENASPCKMVWGMNVDYAFAIGRFVADSKCFCIIGDKCFETVETGDCFGTRIPGKMIDRDVVLSWLLQAGAKMKNTKTTELIEESQETVSSLQLEIKKLEQIVSEIKQLLKSWR